jgi:N-acetylglucosamine kinase-like BadF-type ATPase
MSRYILIDGGQSSCRLVYVVDGRQVLTGRGTGLSRQTRDHSRGVLRVLERAFADLGPGAPGAVDVVVTGLTGFDDSPQTAQAIADGIRSLLRAERVVVTNDAVTSYLGAIGRESGAVVAAGTGVIALAGGREGRFARSDGWGYILGDDGGGYYVGRWGLASALRAYDGRGGSEALRRRAKGRFGSPELMKRRVYEASNPAGEVASFAREVAGAASEGDPLALEIWADAAQEVASTTVAALRRVFDPGATVTVSWAGSLFAERDLLREPFKRHVADAWPAAQLLAPKGTALQGAELIALERTPSMFNALIHVFED